MFKLREIEILMTREIGSLLKATVEQLYYFKGLDLVEQNISDEKIKNLCLFLKTINCTDIKYINLLGNNISDKGMLHLCEYLSSCKSICSLDLTRNPISDKGLKYLSGFIKTTTSLTQLMILNCGITDTGLNDLAEALKINTSLSFVNLCFNGAITTVGVEKFSNTLNENIESNVKVLFEFLNEENPRLDENSFKKMCDQRDEARTELRQTAKTLLSIRHVLSKTGSQELINSKMSFFKIKPLVLKVAAMTDHRTSGLNQHRFIDCIALKKN